MRKPPKRDPLNKDVFMGSVRQIWTAILLGYSLLFSFLQIKYKISPEPYMQFALTIGSLFILGGSVDSYLKINAAMKSSHAAPEDYSEESRKEDKDKNERSN